MRILALVIALAACNKPSSNEPTNTAAGSSVTAMNTASSSQANAAAAQLAMHHVTFLQPEAELANRVEDTEALARAVKEIVDLVIAHDEKHPGALPAELDVMVVMRAGAIRTWLVAADGDLSVPTLEASIARVAPVPIKHGNVGAAATLVRRGAEPAERRPYLPAAWKAAAGTGATIDDAIDKAWPR